MLHIRCSTAYKMQDVDDYILYPSAYFAYYYENDWLEDELGTRILTEIEEIPLVGDTNFQSLLLYGITPMQLAGGSKNLFLCKHFDKLNCLSKMGGNCYHILMDLAEDKDIYMVATGSCWFKESDIKGRPICFDDTQVIVTNQDGFMHQMAEARARGVLSDKI